MGFFSLPDELKVEEPQKRRKASIPTGCEECGLDRSGRDFGFVGKGRDGVLILADYPRDGEDNTLDNIFTHKFYDILFDLAGRRGVPEKILDAAWLGYVLPCPCTKGTNPSPLCCRERLDRLIQELKPRVIIAMGIGPIQALIWDRMAGRIKNTQPTDLAGKHIPDRKYNCWICPTYGPEYVAWQKEDGCPKMYFAEQVRSAWALKDESLPELPDDIKTTEDPKTAASWVKDVLYLAAVGSLDKSPDGVLDVAIDYETTGIKPHREGHRIVAASLAWREGGKYHAVGFRWDGDCPELTKAWDDLIHNKSVGLVAHNASFEACWSRFRAGPGNGRTDWPSNWSWDTCVAAHVIDNNQKVGLKLHTYCELGVIGYDTKADKFISGIMEGEDRDSCNAFNLLASPVGVPWGEVVYYCAQDSLYTLAIRDRQVPQIEGLEAPFRFFMEGVDTLARVQSEGLPIDMSKVDALRDKMTGNYEEALARIMGSTEVKAWSRAHPGDAFNPASNKQLGEVLYDICGLKPPSGKRDVTEDSLSKLGTSLCKDVLAMRHWSKMRDTFLASYSREAAWDEPKQCHLIRPFFNLASGAGSDGAGGPKTYRSSADSPNFQNIPKRDKEMKKLLRSLFVAPPGFRFMEMDYKSLEVMVSASYHHDPQMIHYLQNPESDMHRDTACDMYMRSPQELTKEERSSIKSGYVFSSFYGASYRSCALKMWGDMPAYTKEHLIKDCGIKNYDQWESHVRKADDIFWNKRFKVYNKWRDKEWRRYQDMGYVQGYTGFRCRGPMGFTECANRCIQGSAFHILLRALIYDVRDINEAALSSGMQSRAIGQIHDAIIGLVREGEENALASIVYKNGVEKVSRLFPWICVPLVIEGEMSAVGGTWAEMQDVGELGPQGIVNPAWVDKFPKPGTNV